MLLRGVGLEFLRQYLIGAGKHPHDLFAVSMFFKDTCERLLEPRAFGGVAPREVTCQQRHTTVIALKLIHVTSLLLVSQME